MELKQACRLPRLALLLAFNRTTMELKLRFTLLCLPKLIAFNRTTMELKRQTGRAVVEPCAAF